MAKINYDNLIENLPDSFAKDTDSNNYKLLQIKTHTTSKLLSDLKLMSDMLNMDNAFGYTLDNWYGKRVNLKRGAATDTQYLIQLKAKIMQNTSDGSFPKLVEALAYMFQCSENEILLASSETENAIRIKGIPLKNIEDAHFTTNQLLKLIRCLLAINVKVSEYNMPDIDNSCSIFNGIIMHDIETGRSYGAQKYNTYGDLMQMSYEELHGKTYKELLYKGDD